MNPPGHSAGRQPFAFHIALAPTATLLGQADKEADAPKVLLTCPRWQRHDQAVQGSGTLLWLPRETARLGQHSLAMLPHAPGPVPREDGGPVTFQRAGQQGHLSSRFWANSHSSGGRVRTCRVNARLGLSPLTPRLSHSSCFACGITRPQRGGGSCVLTSSLSWQQPSSGPWPCPSFTVLKEILSARTNPPRSKGRK